MQITNSELELVAVYRQKLKVINHQANPQYLQRISGSDAEFIVFGCEIINPDALYPSSENILLFVRNEKSEITATLPLRSLFFGANPLSSNDKRFRDLYLFPNDRRIVDIENCYCKATDSANGTIVRQFQLGMYFFNQNKNVLNDDYPRT